MSESTPNQAAAPAYRVIFADFSKVKFGTLIEWFKRDNVEALAVTETTKLMTAIHEESFDVCVVNLILGGVGPFELISNLRASSKNRDLKIMAISKQVQKSNIQNTLKAGASDFVAEPFESENLYHRIRYHLTPKQVIEVSQYESSELSADSMAFLEILLESNELLCRTERGQENTAFFKILNDIAKPLGSNRTSLMIVDTKNDSGVVLASSDDEKFVDFPVSLKKYPEVYHVVVTGQAVLIADVSQNALTQQIEQSVKTIQIGGMMVFPVSFAGDVIGVLTIRLQKATGLPPMETMRVIQALANTMAAHSHMRAALRRIYKDYKPAAKAS